MDPRTLHPVLYSLVSLGFTAMLLVILHEYAVRHGSSLTKNLGIRGWVVALEVVFAAGLFSAVVMAVIVTPYNVPVDWTMTLIEGPIIGALGAAVFFLAWRELAGSLPTSPAQTAQKVNGL